MRLASRTALGSRGVYQSRGPRRGFPPPFPYHDEIKSHTRVREGRMSGDYRTCDSLWAASYSVRARALARRRHRSRRCMTQAL